MPNLPYDLFVKVSHRFQWFGSAATMCQARNRIFEHGSDNTTLTEYLIMDELTGDRIVIVIEGKLSSNGVGHFINLKHVSGTL